MASFIEKLAVIKLRHEKKLVTNCLRGSIDAVHNGQCQGWALDTTSNVPVDVEIFIDNRLAARGRADHYRADLEQAGLRDGRLAFALDIPSDLRDGRHHRIEARILGGKMFAVREGVQIVPKLTPYEFDRRAPWIDVSETHFKRDLNERMEQGRLDARAEARVQFFREHGWLLMEQAVPHALIDKVLSDVEGAWRDLPPQQVLGPGLSAPVLMKEMANTPGARATSVRYLDFHNASEAAAEIMMLPEVLRFVELCFDEPVAAMQTLLFENGTQQKSHQDFAFVHSLRPACLMGAWVALEDVSIDAGPLFYWDRSHNNIQKYVFDDGSVLAEGDGPHVRAFEGYLDNTCRELELKRLIFTPRKGDVLVWHSALVHGGMPRKNLELSRKSMVSHYTTQEAYPYDRRSPNQPPLSIERNGGVYYGLRRDGHTEGCYKLDPSLCGSNAQ